MVHEKCPNYLLGELFRESKSKLDLPAFDAHLISLAQSERLVKLQEDGTATSSANETAPA